MAERLDHGELLELKRWNTPTIYNGWEQITRRDRTRDAFNLEETHDFMPQMDTNECRTVIRAARSAAGRSREEVLAALREAQEAFGAAAREKFGAPGEW